MLTFLSYSKTRHRSQSAALAFGHIRTQTNCMMRNVIADEMTKEPKGRRMAFAIKHRIDIGTFVSKGCNLEVHEPNAQKCREKGADSRIERCDIFLPRFLQNNLYVGVPLPVVQ